MARAIKIMVLVRQLEWNTLCAKIYQAFAIAHSHYVDNIDLDLMSLGFAPGYEAHEMDEIETVVTPLLQDLASRIEDIVLPWRG